MVSKAGFWQGKTVFLTGHTGFKGSWMCLLLRRLGAHVVGYSDTVPTTPSLFDLADIAGDVTDVRGDVRDLAGVTQAMQQARPDIVVHMAAQPLVKAGYSDPITTYGVNVMGTANVLEATRQCLSVRVVLVITTDKCYENKEWDWGYREVDELGGYDPYSNSKACAELVTMSYRRSFFGGQERSVAIASARAGNVVGGGDFAADRIVPDAFRSFSAGATLDVRNPAAVRPWQHVLDPLWGYALLVEHAWRDSAPYSQAWNFGPGPANEQTVERIINGMASRWGSGAHWQVTPGHHPKETNVLRIDASKAMRHLNWRPLLDFDAMLDWTADWYRGLAQGQDARALTSGQLDDYLDLVQQAASP